MLDKVHVTYSLLSREIRLVRVGKDPNLALEQRIVMGEVLASLVAWMFDGFENDVGVKTEFKVNGECYALNLNRITEDFYQSKKEADNAS